MDIAHEIEIIQNLDRYINHEDWKVRADVARHGYGLDKLIKDKNEHVRAAVAARGSGLAILVNDESPIVRLAVAKKAGEEGREYLKEDFQEPALAMLLKYTLEKLVNDKDEHVREAAIEQIKKMSDVPTNNVSDILSGIANKISGK